MKSFINKKKSQNKDSEKEGKLKQRSETISVSPSKDLTKVAEQEDDNKKRLSLSFSRTTSARKASFINPKNKTYSEAHIYVPVNNNSNSFNNSLSSSTISLPTVSTTTLSQHRLTVSQSTAPIRVASISVLTDDALRFLFSVLPAIDRLKLRRVCSKWRTLIYKGISELVIPPKCTEKMDDFSLRAIFDTLHELKVCYYNLIEFRGLGCYRGSRKYCQLIETFCC